MKLVAEPAGSSSVRYLRQHFEIASLDYKIDGYILDEHDRWVPQFSNRPADYCEWRARIHLYQKKMVIQKKPLEGVINIVTNLTGIAWKQIEPIAESISDDKDKGFNRLIEALDRTFKYDERVEQPRAFEKFFYSLSRRGEQTLMSYCTEHRECLREVEKHNIRMPKEPVRPGLPWQSWLQPSSKAHWPWKREQPLEETSDSIHCL